MALAKKRPRTAPLSTKDRLLQAATRLFAQNGFHGTSVEMLVKAARANQRMIYHYFGSKKELHDAVLAHAYGELARLPAPAFDASATPESRLRDYLAAYFRFVQAHPEYVRLFIRENIDHGEHVDVIDAAPAEHPVLHQIKQALPPERRSGLEVKLFVLAVIGACQVFQSNRYTMSRWLGLDLNSPGVQAQAEAFIPELLLAGFQSRVLHPASA